MFLYVNNHDIESDLFGTSLGIEVETGKIVAHGHTHHMRAINRIESTIQVQLKMQLKTVL